MNFKMKNKQNKGEDTDDIVSEDLSGVNIDQILSECQKGNDNDNIL
jgi:hypothetical protein